MSVLQKPVAVAQACTELQATDRLVCDMDANATIRFPVEACRGRRGLML
jgi:hypothetical protein